MDASSNPKRNTFYYKQHPLNFVPVPEFTGDARSHCLYPSRHVQPQPGTFSTAVPIPFSSLLPQTYPYPMDHIHWDTGGKRIKTVKKRLLLKFVPFTDLVYYTSPKSSTGTREEMRQGRLSISLKRCRGFPPSPPSRSCECTPQHQHAADRMVCRNILICTAERLYHHWSSYHFCP